ncbi:MAG: 4-hydroxy-tetrahydrodipicolinate synthase [Litorilinea sp.]|nr:MAG: 4-hydroxy-tetrahydrodipicolinate synthase [Litorilinea sp.]
MPQLTGIIPPMVTPFRPDEAVDEEALRADVNYLVEQAHVHGLVVGGSTGEGHTLSTDELRTVVGTAVEAAAGRVPVIAGVIVDSTRQAVERARALADLGAVALQVTPVHYLFPPDDDGMLRHFSAIADASGLPVLIYNVVPWSYCSPALLTRIITEVDGVIGVKQSAGDMKLLADLLLLLDGRGLVHSAVDALLYPSFMLGADGAIAALLTAAPTLCVQLWDAVRQGDHATALDLHRKLLTVWNALEGPNLPANVKTAMALQGRDGGAVRAPMAASSPSQTEAIRRALTAAGLIG